MYKIVNPNMMFAVTYSGWRLPTVVEQQSTSIMGVLDTSDMSFEWMDFDAVLKVYKSYPQLCDFTYDADKNVFVVNMEYSKTININGVLHEFPCLQAVIFDKSKHGRIKLLRNSFELAVIYQYKFKNFIVVKCMKYGPKYLSNKWDRENSKPGTDISNKDTLFYSQDRIWSWVELFYTADGKLQGWHTADEQTSDAHNKIPRNLRTPDSLALMRAKLQKVKGN